MYHILLTIYTVDKRLRRREKEDKEKQQNDDKLTTESTTQDGMSQFTNLYTYL